MIHTDQPTCFPSDLVVAVSSKNDGTVLNRTLAERHTEEVVINRRTFCAANDVDYADVVYQTIVYDDDQTYTKISTVGKHDATQFSDGVMSDALFTNEIGVGLFLPVADCVATVMYDPVKRLLGLVHLGRHSTFAGLASQMITYFTDHDSDPNDIIVWMGPSAQKHSYLLQWFEYEDDPAWQGYFEKTSDGFLIDLQGYNKVQYVNGGVLEKNIFSSAVNTATDPNYFSHSSGDTSGRIAVLAMMR